MINFVAFKSEHDLEYTNFNGPWVGPADNTEFFSMFEHWEPEVQALLDVSFSAKILGQ